MVGGDAVGVRGLTTLGGTTCGGLNVGAMEGSRVPDPSPRGESFEMGTLGGVMVFRSNIEGGCRTDGAIFIRLLKT